MDGFDKRLPFDFEALKRINALVSADQMLFAKQIIGAVLVVKQSPVQHYRSAIDNLTAEKVLEYIADRVHPDALLMDDIKIVLNEIYDECEDLVLDSFHPAILPVAPIGPEPF